MTRKIFSQAAAIFFFFYRFSGDILFSSVVSFAFFDSCFLDGLSIFLNLKYVF